MAEDAPMPPDPMTAPSIRWGVVGPGGIAHKFVDAVQRHTASEVVAVASRDAERAAPFAARHGIVRSYAGHDRLLEDPLVEAVYVATPHSAHRDIAVAALRAGKHVLVEKALARNGAEVEDIFAAAHASGLFAMEAMWTRFLPHMVALRGALAGGVVGDVVAVVADHGQRFAFDPSHRLYNPDLAGGALLDLGVYPLAFVHDVLGAPESLQVSGTLAETGVDGQVGLLLGYPGRRIGLAHTTLWSRTPTTATVSGTLGRVEIAGPFYRPAVVRVHPDHGEPWVIDLPVENGFEFEIAEAARCIAQGRCESDIMPWNASREVMAIIDEARRCLGVVYPGE